MKKFLTSTSLVALSVSGLHAAYAPDLTPMETSKPWSVSAALRGFYDDNYTTSPSKRTVPVGLFGATEEVEPEDSFGYEFKPSVSLNLPLDQTFFGVSYEYTLKYYENRKGDKYDQSHEFDLRLDHRFSERYKIEVNNSLVIAQEPEVLSPGNISSPLRTEGDNIRNLGTIDFTAQLTELLDLELGYANTFYDYEQDEGDVAVGTASRSGLLDRMEHEARVDLRWQMLPETSGILGYTFGIVDFTADETIGTNFITGEAISSDIRNNRSHRVYVGADHRFNSQLSGSARVGGQYTDYYNDNESAISPYVDANLAYQYSRGNHLQVGVNHTRNQTDVAAFDANSEDITRDQESTRLYASVEHKITPNLVGSALFQAQYSTFEGGRDDGESELLFLSGVNLAYHFNQHWLAEAGYNFDRLDSNLEGRSYSRNRAYIGVRATY